MRQQLLALTLGFAIMGTLQSCGVVHAATPDEVRAAAQAAALARQVNQVDRENKEAKEKASKVARQPLRRSWLMTIRTPGQPLTFLQMYQDEAACRGNEKLLTRQLAHRGWGKAACLEQVNP